MAPTFERLHRDPRLSAQDLKQVYVGSSTPRDAMHDWRKLLKKWNIAPPPQTRYQFFLNFDPTGRGDEIFNRGSAKKWLQEEDDVWNILGGVRSTRSHRYAVSHYELYKREISPVGAMSEKYRHEDLEKAVKPAFGFWLFPLDAHSPILGEETSEDEGYRHRLGQLLDLTSYWPELALQSLP